MCCFHSIAEHRIRLSSTWVSFVDRSSVVNLLLKQRSRPCGCRPLYHRRRDSSSYVVCSTEYKTPNCATQSFCKLESSLHTFAVVCMREIEFVALLIRRDRNVQEFAERLVTIFGIEFEQLVLGHNLTHECVMAVV